VPVELLGLASADDGAAAGVAWVVRPLQALTPVGHRVELLHAGVVAATLDVRLPGMFNVTNAALAAAMLLTAGVGQAAVELGIAAFGGVPGRMEVVERGQPFVALVDYAHTPDALESVLRSLREGAAARRLIVVVGCGGDRDVSKRPHMGRVAAELADVVVVTDDNPRSEDPATIRAAVLRGARDARTHASLLEVGDRAEAIRTAVGLASQSGAGCTLVVAGKGHESGQQVGDVMLPFDDRSALTAALDAEGNRAT
jgi:UDP-N-acetylmuramoyl-L-alanyl-D-glutamate--2,6-diaminopimelate ligase